MPSAFSGKERDRKEWEHVCDVIAVVEKYVPQKVPARPRTLLDARAFATTLGRHRTGADLTADEQDALRDWSEWRHELTRIEAENAGTLQLLLDTTHALSELCTRYEGDFAVGVRALEALRSFLHEHYRVKRVPEERDKRRWLARKATVRTDVMPNEWRDPEHREVSE